MSRTAALAIVIVVIFVVGALLWYTHTPPRVEVPQTLHVSQEEVADYIRAHISELSPEPAVLGGTFYVTQIEVRDGAGTVSYEDGHIALTADFTYTTDTGTTTVTSFTVKR